MPSRKPKVQWEATKPALTLPKCEHGIDWGAKRRLLVQVGTKQVFYRPGHTAWMCVGSQGYYPGALMTYDYDDRNSRIGRDLREGGRLSKKLFTELAPKIAEFLGVGVKDLPQLDRNTTWTATL
jgi:hypothetical protein